MALRYKSRKRFIPTRKKRNFRYMNAFNTNRVSVAAGSQSVIQLISPTLMATYGMTGKNTIASVQGYLRWDCVGPFSSANPFLGARCAMGVYVDSDLFDPISTKLPYQDSNSTQWMIWRADSLGFNAYYNGTTLAAVAADYGTTGRKMSFMTRKYKRTLDGSSDSLVMCIQNSAQSTSPIAYDYYFRILVLER